MSSSYPEGVSLIICTYNGAARLPSTIGHINRVIADEAIPWEFILIDNSSDDGSGQVSLALWKRSEPIRVVVENQKGLIHARYKGIREAKYEYISFIDDDNWIDPYWIDNIYRIFREHPEVGMCGGQNAGAFEKEPPEWAEKILSSYAIGIQGKATGNITGSKGFVWGAGMSFRKSAFERLIEAGYNSLLTGRNGKNLAAGEDSELGFAFRLAGWKIWYDESLRLQHYIPASRFDWKYVVKMYDGFGSSHAIFGLYKPVLKGKTYQPARFYRKIFRDFWPLYLKKLNGQISLAEGNLDYLKYRLHRAKVLTALKNFYRNRKLIRAIKNLKNTIRKEHQL